MAAARVGPKTRKPRSRSASTMPSDSGSSGPTTVRSGRSASASRDHRVQVFRGPRGRSAHICAMPPLPGAQTTSVTRSTRLTAHASACSRPPEPRIKTFIAIRLVRLRSAAGMLMKVMVGNAAVVSQTHGRRNARTSSQRFQPILSRGRCRKHFSVLTRNVPQSTPWLTIRIKPYQAAGRRARGAPSSGGIYPAQPGVRAPYRGGGDPHLVALPHQSRSGSSLPAGGVRDAFTSERTALSRVIMPAPS